MNNKLLKHLSELFVIIAGITISLFFDELAEDYKKSKLEKYYLQSLLENLKEDSSQLQIKIQFTEKIDKDTDGLLKYYLENPPPEISAQQLANGKTSILQHTIFASNQSVYEELKSTGTFITIKNKQLKNAIFKYYGAVKSTRGNDLSADNVISYYVYPRLNDNVQLASLALADSADFQFLFKNLDLKKVELQKRTQVSTNKDDILNAIIIRKGINAAQKGEYVNLAKSNQILIVAISKELSGK